MDNIEIILNQNKNVNYLGKFYNRNKLEFPILRKIYENAELSKSTSPIPNNINTVETINTIDKNTNTVDKNSNTADKNSNMVDKNSNKLDTDELIIDNEIVIIKNDTDIKPIETLNKPIQEKSQDIIENSFLLNTSKTIFLWISSLIIMSGIEQYVFRNLF